MRGVVVTTSVSTSLVGSRPASARNLAASPSALSLSVCWNSTPESGLVRMSLSLTMPTVTAFAGTSDSASSLANAGTAASARSMRSERALRVIRTPFE